MRTYQRLRIWGDTQTTKETREKAVSEAVLMFSGLEVQSEINRLLDELYDNLDRATLDEVGGPRVGYASQQGDELAREARDKKVWKEQQKKKRENQ